MRCRSCDTPNPPERTTCAKCGAKLPPPRQAVVAEEKPQPKPRPRPAREEEYDDEEVERRPRRRRDEEEDYEEEERRPRRRRPADEDEDDDRPRRRRDEEADVYDDEEEEGVKIIPTGNIFALIAYYCGIFSLIPSVVYPVMNVGLKAEGPLAFLNILLPLLGFVLGGVALLLGVLGIIRAKSNRRAKGGGHAVSGIVLGSAALLICAGILILRQIEMGGKAILPLD